LSFAEPPPSAAIAGCRFHLVLSKKISIFFRFPLVRPSSRLSRPHSLPLTIGLLSDPLENGESRPYASSCFRRRGVASQGRLVEEEEYSVASVLIFLPPVSFFSSLSGKTGLPSPLWSLRDRLTAILLKAALSSWAYARSSPSVRRVNALGPRFGRGSRLGGSRL